MEIIKTKRINGYDFTLIYFQYSKGYEIQISEKPYDEITDTEGFYTNKKVALKVYNDIVKNWTKNKILENLN